MRNLLIVFTLMLIFQCQMRAQRKADIGLIGGTDFYIGDMNPDIPFLSPRYAFGPIFRHNFNDRYSIRFQGVYANLEGNEDPARNISQRVSPANFSVNLINLATQVEYNFFDYKTGDKPGFASPYIFGGFGYSLMLAAQTNTGISPENHMTMPFGVGGKVNLTRRLSGGIEWSMNKSFSDRTDGVISPLPDSEKLLYGNDWYSFLGLFFTYKFFKFADDCPVYD